MGDFENLSQVDFRDDLLSEKDVDLKSLYCVLWKTVPHSIKHSVDDENDETFEL